MIPEKYFEGNSSLYDKTEWPYNTITCDSCDKTINNIGIIKNN